MATQVAFVCNVRPLTANHRARGADGARRRDDFQFAMKSAFVKAAGGEGKLTGPCYGVVYYLPKQPRTPDADNLSKPVWDALKDVAYADDAVIRLRVAGIVDLARGDIDQFDLTQVPAQAADALLAQAGQVEHLLYVEIGELCPEMFRFGLAVWRP